jgi:nitrate reductase NapE component
VKKKNGDISFFVLGYMVYPVLAGYIAFFFVLGYMVYPVLAV